MINGLCEGMVCVKGCNTENDNWFLWKDGLYEGMYYYLVCVKGYDKWFLWRWWFVWRDAIQRIILGWFTQTICHSLYYITSHKPDNHTNHLAFSVLHPFTQTITSCKPFIITPLCTNHPFTQSIPSHKQFIILCITFYLFCVKGCNKENDKWFVWWAGLRGWFIWSIPFTQTILSQKRFIILCITFYLVCVKGWIVSGVCEGIESSHRDQTQNLHFKQTIYPSLYYILSGLCEGMVCVNNIPSHKPDNMKYGEW